MKRNRLIVLTTVVTLSSFAVGCGGSSETNSNAGVAANNNSTMSETNASRPGTSAPPASPANVSVPPDGTTSNAGRNAPVSKDPAPQIGTGGNDMFLFTQARAALNTDNELKPANINISINGGVVTLTGKVSGDAQKAKAEQLMRGIKGVVSVKNQLGTSAGGAKR